MSRPPPGPGAARGLRAAGFTILELLVALTIGALLLAVSVPAGTRLYSSMQYHAAVRGALSLLAAARYEAVRAGLPQDVKIDVDGRALRLGGRVETLPAELNLVARTAAQLNEPGVGVIRFYPEGGSSGGELDIERPGESGVRLTVDWLAGGVSQMAYAVR